MKKPGIGFWCGLCTVFGAAISLVGSALGAKKQQADIQEAANKAVNDLLTKKD